MPSLYDHEEVPLPLVRRSYRKMDAAMDAAMETDSDSLEVESERPVRGDRMRPSLAGGVMGLLAGAAAFGVVHGLQPAPIAHLFAGGAAQWGVSHEIATAIAYGTAAAAGGLVGAAFASVTRHLRRFIPLLIWALVFFVSLTMLVLAATRTYAGGAGTTLTPAILAASAAFAFVAAFQLPLRRRG